MEFCGMKYIPVILTFLFSPVLLCGQGKTAGKEKKMVTVPRSVYNPFFITPGSGPEPVASFKMDETAVTNLDFLTFVEANPQWRRSKVSRLYADSNYLKHWKSDLEIGGTGNQSASSPVVNVSWFAANAYAAWKNKRLPTVAEWEIAADGAPVNMKNQSLTEYVLGWFARPNPPVLPAVKSTYKNVYGLYDMNGLIWEWTFDFNSFVSSGDSRDSGEDAKNFCAGGAVNVSDKKNYAAYLRFSYRGSLRGNYCIANLGFRCVQNIN